MHCPRCGYPMYCGCPACYDDVPDGYKPSVDREVETPGGTACLEACARCGFEMPGYWWENLDCDVWLKYRDRGDPEQIIDNDASWREYQERIE